MQILFAAHSAPAADAATAALVVAVEKGAAIAVAGAPLAAVAAHRVVVSPVLAGHVALLSMSIGQRRRRDIARAPQGHRING